MAGKFKVQNVISPIQAAKAVASADTNWDSMSSLRLSKGIRNESSCSAKTLTNTDSFFSASGSKSKSLTSDSSKASCRRSRLQSVSNFFRAKK